MPLGVWDLVMINIICRGCSGHVRCLAVKNWLVLTKHLRDDRTQYRQDRLPRSRPGIPSSEPQSCQSRLARGACVRPGRNQG